jgi:catalase-peroxidase
MSASETVKNLKAAAAGCPMHTSGSQKASSWWPNKLDLNPLGKGCAPSSNPTGSYASLFSKLDLAAVKADLAALMTDSQPWWPADYGNYGPFFIRMAWHSAGTYRTFDGRGGGGRGNLRFAPLNSWPDNGNLDKARRLLWPVKKKYGRSLSWADLMILTGNVALETMGFKTFGFAGGREDIWEPEEDVYWGQEKAWLAAERGGLGEDLERPLGAVQMGLIYVNPEGPGGNPDVLKSAEDIRATFGRMAMNDEETVALIAGGHTFGKAHGANNPGPNVGPEPEGAGIVDQGFGWKNTWESGKGVHTITSGLEGAWTAKPTMWDNGYFDNLFNYEWEQTKSPAGATQWVPKGGAAADAVPDAHDPDRKHAPIMFTTDLALKEDPAYGPISKRFHENPDQFAEAFAKAWYKLTHRDMGPYARCLGSEVPPEQIWQDPCGEQVGPLIGDADVAELKTAALSAGSVSQLVKAAWASASTFRGTDFRGGSNGGRVRLAPQKDWAANDPAELATVLTALEGVRATFNGKGGAQVSMADMVIIAGCAAVEQAAGGKSVPFTPGRTDASDEQTDANSFRVLEPHVDGFRNFASSPGFEQYAGVSPESMLIDKARMLNLTKSELAVLVGGLRVLGANAAGSTEGVFTSNVGVLSNDFFVNLIDMSTEWVETGSSFQGKDRATGEVKWTASRVDLVFGSNSELRAMAEYYACDDGGDAFVDDFLKAWGKVMAN